MPYKNIYEHREQEAARARRYYYANKEKCLATDRAYRANEHNKLREKEQQKVYRKTNPDKRATWDRTRRQHKMNAPGDGVTSGQWDQIKLAHGRRCVYCGKKPIKLVMDHVHPLKHGGAHDVTNIAPACQSCNSSKGARILHKEWTPPLKK